MGNTLEKGTKIVGEDQRVDFPLTFNCQRGCVNQIKRERESTNKQFWKPVAINLITKFTWTVAWIGALTTDNTDASCSNSWNVGNVWFFFDKNYSKLFPWEKYMYNVPLENLWAHFKVIFYIYIKCIEPLFGFYASLEKCHLQVSMHVQFKISTR